MCVMWASPVSSRVIVTTQVEWTGGVSLKGVEFFFFIRSLPFFITFRLLFYDLKVLSKGLPLMVRKYITRIWKKLCDCTFKNINLNSHQRVLNLSSSILMEAFLNQLK
jgi:hypothetical protein